MQFGLFLNSQDPTDSNPMALVDGIIRQARAGNEYGFDLISMGQHYMSEYHQAQLIPMLSRLTAEVDSMSIATGIILLPLHHPIEIAEQLATVDLLADEVIAGVGAGYRDDEFDNFGVPKSQRGARLREGVEIMNRLWSGSNVTYSGDIYEITDATINPRPKVKPPVWIAANAQRAVNRAARIGDAWYVNPHGTVEEIVEKKHRYDEIRNERNLDTAVPMLREVVVAETTEEARQIGWQYLKPKYEQYVEWGQNEAMDDNSELSRPFDRLINDRFLLGTPSEVCEQIDRITDAIAVSHLVLRPKWPGMSYDQAVESIGLLGDEVIPYV